MSYNSSGSSGGSSGLGILSVLQIIFIVLKLCGVIDWSWWLVLTPLWISLGLCLIAVIITAFIKWRASK